MPCTILYVSYETKIFFESSKRLMMWVKIIIVLFIAIGITILHPSLEELGSSQD